MFKLGERVKFYLGDYECKGFIESLLPNGDYIIAGDNNLFYTTSADNIQILEEMTVEDELAKYKRAFEILKDTVDFNIFCREVKKGDGVEKTYFIIFGEIWIKIDKEEYELLKEVFGE